jgi:hypothetical protein
LVAAFVREPANPEERRALRDPVRRKKKSGDCVRVAAGKKKESGGGTEEG